MTLPNSARTIRVAGLLAGALDLAAAIVTNLPRGIGAMAILQSIASGMLGRDAYQGGMATATLGVLAHFFIMFVIAACFYFASLRLHMLVRHAMIAGLAYGVAVYAFMNLVVLPLSAFPHARTFGLATLATGLLVHMLCVGLPIALVTRQRSTH